MRCSTLRSPFTLGMASIAASMLGSVTDGFAQSAPTSAIATASVSARTLWVTNDGADSATCGSRPRPCRSISQAIENAADGDTIWVGAGHYGSERARLPAANS